MTPNPYRAQPVEALMMWDWRQQNLAETMKEWGSFASDLRDRDLGVRVMNISLDNDKAKVLSFIRYYEYTQSGIKDMENYFDVTNLRDALNITVVPTFVFIDRRAGNVVRLEGHQALAELRRALLEVAGREADSGVEDEAWQPRASWFSIEPEHAVDSEQEREIFPPTVVDPEALPPGATPVMPRTAPAPWLPE